MSKTTDIDEFLKKAFDFQKFENDPALAELISETEKRCGKGLTDDELESVSAAGDIKSILRKRKDNQDV